MEVPIMRKFCGIVIVLMLTILSGWALSGRSASKRPSPERQFEFTYQTEITDIPAGTKHLDIWIPYPTSDENQTISDVKIESPFKTKITKDPEYGNSILYMGVDHPQTTSATVRMKFNVKRRENWRKEFEELS